MLVRVLLIFGLAVSPAFSAERWSFHFEAEKGETMVSIANEPKALDYFLFELPSFSPDPLTPGAVISSVRIRKLGYIGEHGVIEVRSRVREDYYNHLYLLLVEVTSGRYLPLYGQQYSEGIRAPKLTDFAFRKRELWLQVRVDYSGTGAHRTIDDILIGVDEGGQLRLTTQRKQ